MGKPEYAGPRYVFSHPQLGDLTGRLVASKHFPGHPAVQFRSIPYATVPKRFSPSVPLTDIPTEFDGRPHRDFTTFGVGCPQIGPENPAFFEAYGGPLEDDIGMELDEFTCLNLTLSVPEAQLASLPAQKQKLPVLVYIHGGGAQEGVAHIDGLHSNTALASFAASLDQPVITVNIGYRLGWFASLVCKDILSEFEAAPTSPHGPFNVGMQDQRNAFTWLHSFIDGFGGDSTNITVFGESAGSVFLTYHICGSATRLFDRAILQSGLVFGDLPLETKEEEYQAILKHFNIQGETAAERLDALRKIEPLELAQFPGSHMTPYMGPIPGVKPEDSLFSRGPATILSQMELIASCPWLDDIVIGEDFWEGMVFFPVFKQFPASTFIDTIDTVFTQPEAQRLLAAYDIDKDMDANRAWTQLSLCVGDLMFSGPYHMLAEALSASSSKKRNVYRYSFALRNPFPGSFISFYAGHHFVEILYIFLTLLDRYPTDRNHWAARQAKETAHLWILFANGRQPWEPYNAPDHGSDYSPKLAVCDDLRGWQVRTIKEDEELSKDDPWGARRYAGWRAIEDAFAALSGDGERNSVNHAEAISLARLKILHLVFGSLGRIRLPGQETLAQVPS